MFFRDEKSNRSYTGRTTSFNRLWPKVAKFSCTATVRHDLLCPVHCYNHCVLGGISLSPAFVVMFVMRHCQLSWEDALHLVQNRRYCISPNGGFLTQIKVHNPLADKVALSLLILTSFDHLCRNTNLYTRLKLRLPIFPRRRYKEWCLGGRGTMKKKIRGSCYYSRTCTP